MSGTTLARHVKVSTPHGLHARPADLIVRLASKFQSRVELLYGDRRVDGKSILDILTLGAASGTTLAIEATGEDAELALEAISKLIESDFSENGEA